MDFVEGCVGGLAGVGAEAAKQLETVRVLVPALQLRPQVDWSPAVLCWCKALEVEVARIALSEWVGDVRGFSTRGAWQVAGYLSGTGDAPGLGLSAQFLRYGERRDRDRRWLSGHPFREWILGAKGLSAVLEEVRKEYRNPAAHWGVLGKGEYVACAGLIGGKGGALRKLWGVDG